jgi:hypothetical protein
LGDRRLQRAGDLPIEGACPRCGSTATKEVMLGAVPHQAGLICDGCGRHIRFIKAEWSVERALAFPLEFGRHRGRTVGDLVKTADGRSYLRWVADTVRGAPATAARIALDANVR